MINKVNYQPPISYTNEEKLIWKLLIFRDFVAFCTKDWSIIENDFIKEGFFGIDGKKSHNKKDWCLTYHSLEAYKNDWISQSKDFNKKIFLNDPLEVLFKTTKLSKIEIKDTTALVHKEFKGVFKVKDEPSIILDWISLFVLRRVKRDWKIVSFTGYLPK
jgi:hypothetical protein